MKMQRTARERVVTRALVKAAAPIGYRPRSRSARAELEKEASPPPAEKTASQTAWEDNWELKRKKALGPMPKDPKARTQWVARAKRWEAENPGASRYLVPGTKDTPKAGATPPWEKAAAVARRVLWQLGHD